MSMARHSCFLVIKNGISESKTHKIVEKSAEEVARMTLQRGKIFCFFDAVVLVLHPPAERACIIIRLKQSVKKVDYGLSQLRIFSSGKAFGARSEKMQNIFVVSEKG